VAADKIMHQINNIFFLKNFGRIMKLKNKTALITGAGSGIGKASAILFAKEGAKVALLGRTKDELQKVEKEIKRNNGDAIVIQADISNENEMIEAYKTLEKKWNGLDIVFANAGINGVWAPIEDLKFEEWKKTININLNGTFLTIKYAVPLLKKNGGSIVITSSINGTRIFSNSGASAYSSTKAGQVALTKMLALELAQYKIRVNVICPGAIETEIDDNTEKKNIEKAKEPVEFPEGSIPLTDGKPGTSNQVAQLVLFLSSDDSSHITGTEVWIDGGQSLLEG
jgi:NAD(P)-dependent dehydrogenase (short-subunit alcohol dehydrogenase family)